MCGSDLHMHYRPADERRRGRIFGLVTGLDVVPGVKPGRHRREDRLDSIDHLEPAGTGRRVHRVGDLLNYIECRRGFDEIEDGIGIYGLDQPGPLQGLHRRPQPDW